MITILDHQRDALAQAAQHSFETRLLSHLAGLFPEAVGALGPGAAREAVRQGTKRAARHEITSERGVFAYLEVAFLLGHDFDTELDWAAAILADLALADPDDRIQTVLEEALERRAATPAATAPAQPSPAVPSHHHLHESRARYASDGTAGKLAQPLASKHVDLQVQAVSFVGHHPLSADRRYDFAEPEWLFDEGERDGPQRGLQSPVCYTRGQRIELRVRLDVLRPPARRERVEIHGHTGLGLRFRAQVDVAPDDREVVVAMASDLPLPAEVACHDPLLIEWLCRPEGADWSSAGKTDHLLYVLLGDPPAGQPVLWTLAHLSCLPSQGATDEPALARGIVQALAQKPVRRQVDDELLTFGASPDGGLESTSAMLSQAAGKGPLAAPSEGWAQLFTDMLRTHGVASAAVVRVTVHDDAGASGGGAALLMGRWQFDSSATDPQKLTHELDKTCRPEPPPPVAFNARPAAVARSHFLVRLGADYCDPFYGIGPCDLASWLEAATSGIFTGKPGGPGRPNVGYSPVLPTMVQLVDVARATSGPPALP